jgi:hypothetical protein
VDDAEYPADPLCAVDDRGNGRARAGTFEELAVEVRAEGSASFGGMTMT